MFELLLEIPFWFLGACVGILWPAKSAAWLRWQRIGIALGVAATVSFFAAFGIAYFHGWVAASRRLVWIACFLTAGYLIVGNICLMYHEARETIR